ncbi:MAG: glutamate 5-kinase [Kiritimatiellia bacterium]
MDLSEKRYREILSESRRIVVKVGSRVIVSKSGCPELKYLTSLADQVAKLREKGYDVILVSSGAVAAGMEALGIKERPTLLSDQQMCAAVGQARLIAQYEQLFLARKVNIGQVLLTHADFQNRLRLANARRTFDHLLRAGVVPIVNENDVVADEELKAGMSFGDNDYLAALVTKLTRADLLCILSTVDGLLDMSAKSPTRISLIEKLDNNAFKLVCPIKNALSKGGMDSKLKSAGIAVKAGSSVVIAGGRNRNVLTRIVAGEDEGTLILSAPF